MTQDRPTRPPNSPRRSRCLSPNHVPGDDRGNEVRENQYREMYQAGRFAAISMVVATNEVPAGCSLYHHLTPVTVTSLPLGHGRPSHHTRAIRGDVQHCDGGRSLPLGYCSSYPARAWPGKCLIHHYQAIRGDVECCDGDDHSRRRLDRVSRFSAYSGERYGCRGTACLASLFG